MVQRRTMKLCLTFLNIVFITTNVSSTSEVLPSIMKLPQSGTFRLRDGRSESEGRIEVYYNGTWGSVCAYKWGIVQSAMVCRSLGFQDTINSLSYEKGSLIRWLFLVICPFGARSLSDCTHEPWGYDKYDNCHLYGDAGTSCTNCQINIGGNRGLNCDACSTNGVGKCDPYGCPNFLTLYNNDTKLCKRVTVDKAYECEKNHMIGLGVKEFKHFTAFSKQTCINMCIIEEGIICTGVNYWYDGNFCVLYGVNKYTAPKNEYVKQSQNGRPNTACAIGLCPPGQAMTINNTCYDCPVNHYKIHRGSPCIPCKLGYDTNGLTRSTECRKTCAAGSYSRGGVYCESCPEDTYKKHNDGSECLKCPKSTTTGGEMGQIQCKSQFQHVMNEYGFYYIGVLSGFLSVLSCCWSMSKKAIKKSCNKNEPKIDDDVSSSQILDFMTIINEKINNINQEIVEMKNNAKQQSAIKEMT